MATPEQIAPGVWRAGTRFVNFYLVDEADGVTLIDAGLPSYGKHLRSAITYLGRRRGDIKAVLLTHGHIDHVGGTAAAADAGARVHLHPADVGLANDARKNRTERPLGRYAYWPATAAFLAHAVASGATHPRQLPPTVDIHDAEVLDAPGNPRVRHTPGHTDGSCVFHFPDHDALFAGDLLCTSDPLTGRHVAPQIQTRGSNLDSGRTMRSLDLITDIDATWVLPGHGAPWSQGVEHAVHTAKATGCR